MALLAGDEMLSLAAMCRSHLLLLRLLLLLLQLWLREPAAATTVRLRPFSLSFWLLGELAQEEDVAFASG